MMLRVPKKVYKLKKLDLSEERIKNIYLSFRYLNSDSPSSEEYTVYEEFNIELGKLNIIYGKSGSGKSSLLNYFKNVLSSQYLIESIPDDYVINLVGGNTKEAIKILNYVGLGEGNLFLRRYSQLSDGQKFRMKIAYQIYSIKDKKDPIYILIDEFGGLLDKVAAKGIARMLHKFLFRYTNVNFIICCNDEEIVDSFKYDSLIKLNLDRTVDVIYSKEKDNKLKVNYQIKKAEYKDYLKFKQYHYLDLGKDNYDIYIAIDIDNNVEAGCIVISKVIPPEIVKKHEVFNRINDSIINIKRLVIHPEYRGLDLTKKFIEYLSRNRSEKIIEISSALFAFIPVPLSWGFEDVNELFDEYYNKNRDANLKIKECINKVGYNTWDILDEDEYLGFIKKLDLIEIKTLVYEDMKERMTSLIYYYWMLMKRYNLEVNLSLRETTNIFIEDIDQDMSEEDMKLLIQNNEQPAYGAFCLNIGARE